jgi:hypothetical protein
MNPVFQLFEALMHQIVLVGELGRSILDKKLGLRGVALVAILDCALPLVYRGNFSFRWLSTRLWLTCKAG